MGLAVAILRGGRTASGTHRFRHAPLQGHGVLNHPVPGARGLKCGEHGLGRARFGGAPRRGAPRGAGRGVRIGREGCAHRTDRRLGTRARGRGYSRGRGRGKGRGRGGGATDATSSSDCAPSPAPPRAAAAAAAAAPRGRPSSSLMSSSRSSYRVRVSTAHRGRVRVSTAHRGRVRVSTARRARRWRQGGTWAVGGRRRPQGEVGTARRSSPLSLAPAPPPSRTNWTRLVPPSRTNWTPSPLSLAPAAPKPPPAARAWAHPGVFVRSSSSRAQSNGVVHGTSRTKTLYTVLRERGVSD